MLTNCLHVMRIFIFLLSYLAVDIVNCHPTFYQHHNAFDNLAQDHIEIKYVYIYSEIQLTHGITIIKSYLVNTDFTNSRQAKFKLTLPNEGFIKNFTLEMNGILFESHIFQANMIRNGQHFMGLVEQIWKNNKSSTDSHSDSDNHYNLLVNLQPKQSVTMTVIYEEQIELLARVNALTYQYKHDLKSELMKRVQDFQVVITIEEPNNIKNPIFPNLRSRTNPGNILSINQQFIHMKNMSPNTTRISWTPDEIEMKSFLDEGCLGKFILQYEIDAAPGEILVGNGYILREGIRKRKQSQAFQELVEGNMSKHIIFVLDVSGSMEGNKLEQLKDGMVQIINQTHSQNYFSILTFSNTVEIWQALTYSTPRPVPAIREFKSSAINYITHLQVGGSTNIFTALKYALVIGQKWNSKNNASNSFIFFLTDGEPTSGLINHIEILGNILKLNHQNSPVVPIFTLAFGHEADFKLCTQISHQNSGFSRQIFENIHSAKQLEEFYHEIIKTFEKSRHNEIIRFKYTDIKDSNTASYYQLETELFKILFKSKYNDTETEPGKISTNSPGSMRQEFTNVAAVMVDAGIRNEDCRNPYFNEDGDEICQEKIILSASTIFRIKLFLTLQFQDETTKLKRRNSSCSMILLELESRFRNESLITILNNINSALKYNLVTPCTSLLVT